MEAPIEKLFRIGFGCPTLTNLSHTATGTPIKHSNTEKDDQIEAHDVGAK